jgi:hypothetical protein
MGCLIMRILRFLLPAMLGLSLAVTFAVPALAAQRTPPGSYLKYAVTTVDDLCDQVASDPVVQARYSIHFGISSEEIGNYFRENLQIITLPQSLRTQVWFVDTKGRTQVKTKNLPKGTKVFATTDGKAVLQFSCGNPLMTRLPARIATKPVTETIQSENATVAAVPPVSEVETMVLPAPEEIITTAVVMAPPATEVAAVLPIAAAPPVQPIAAAAVSMPPVVAAAAAAGGSAGSMLGVLGGLAGIAAAAGGGGSSNPSPPQVPEPSTLLSLMGCLAAMPMLSRFRRK